VTSSSAVATGPRAASRRRRRSVHGAGPPPTRAATRPTPRDADQMTWSIIAHDKSTGQFGIAVSTKFFAVGARVPNIVAGVGAIATQAMVNPYYGIDGVKLLEIGLEPQSIIDALPAR